MAKAKPGALNYGSGGTGSSIHLAVELFKQKAGVDITRIAYKGAGPAMNDLLGGQIAMLMATPTAFVQHIRSGRLKAIAVTSAKRFQTMPDVPTLAENGIKDAESLVWFGRDGPLKLPRAIVDTLNREVNRALTLPDVRKRLDELGLEIQGGSPEDMNKFVKSEIAKIERLVKTGYLKVE